MLKKEKTNMFDYIINIKKNGRIICSFGSKNMVGYDNVQWWQLDKLVSICNFGFNDVKSLINQVESETEYFHFVKEPISNDSTLDLDNETIEMPSFPIYKKEDANPNECCISLKEINGQIYADYGDEELYLMKHVSFDNVDLLMKRTVTLNEFKKVCNFVDALLSTEDTDFVLNNNYVIRLNNV